MKRPIGIVGWSGAGKTTLITALIPALKARGLSVSTVKHTHHDIELDKPGKDSFRHRDCGAAETLLAGPRRWALIHEHANAPDGPDEPPLEALLAKLSPVDLVIIEGFKYDDVPKIEVHRPVLGKALFAAERADIVAVAADGDVAGLAVPRLDLNDPAGIATFIAETITRE